MDRLEELLQDNYKGLKPQTKDECIDTITVFIERNSSVLDRDPHFIKKLTKVAWNIVSCSEILNDYLERIYQYSLEGIEIINLDIDKIKDPNKVKLESHLYSYAGDFAIAIYEKTKQISWAKIAYNHYIKSAKMSEKSEPRYSAHSFLHAGDAVRIVIEYLSEHNREYDREKNLKKVTMGWKKTAKACYDKFFGYYELNPMEEMNLQIFQRRCYVRQLGI